MGVRMDDNRGGENVEQKFNFRFDRSISLPTILTVLAMLAGWWWWGTQIYTDLRLSERTNAQDIAFVKADVARIEQQQANQAQGMKDDLHDINNKLDRLTDRLIGGTSMKGWVKQ